jgi:uncharacterized repeat protein (TIGR02543 family)
MANAKLWWTGSGWTTSETWWADNTSGGDSSWARVVYKNQIVAYDDGKIRMSTVLKAISSYGSPFITSGTKTVKSGSTTLGSGQFTGLDVTAYTDFSYSGNVACGMNEYGSTTYHPGAQSTSSGSTSITSPFCTITFNANHGSGAPAALTACRGASSTLPGGVPTRTGYSFLGWSTSSSATTASYSPGGTIVVSGNTTLYAVWKANSYSLTITKPATGYVSILKNGESFTGNTVQHDDVLTITATASPGYRVLTLKVNGSDFVSGSTHTVSGAVAIVVDTIAQSSTIATYDSSVNTLDTFSLTVNRYSTSHYNKLRYYDSNDNLLFTSDVFTDSTSLTIPQSWFTNFGSVTSITITAILTTYTEPECTNITGVTDTCTFTVTADATMRPTLAAGVITLTPYNTGTGVDNLTSPGFVKGYSKVQAVFDTSKISHAVGASAGTYAISLQGVSVSGSSTTLVSSNTITLAGTVTITYTVTDSRGRSTTATQTISVNDYANPAIGSLNCFRCYNTQPPIADDGQPYMAVTANCTFTQLSNNAITITVQAKPTGGSYTSYGTLQNGTQAVIGGSFLADTSYFVKVTVTDSVGNSAYTEMSMPRRSWDFHVRHTANGAGAAFGKVTEHDLTLQLATNWEFMIGSTSISENDLIYFLTLSGLIGNVSLPTTAQTITGAIAELDGDVSSSQSAISTLQSSVSGITPKKATITLNTTWSGSGPYTKTVTISGATITANTKVDVQFDATAIAQMVSDGTNAIYISNNNGTLTAYAVGAKPTESLSLQVIYYETA